MNLLKKIILFFICIVLFKHAQANMTNGQWTSMSHNRNVNNPNYQIVGKQSRRIIYHPYSNEFAKEGYRFEKEIKLKEYMNEKRKYDNRQKQITQRSSDR